MAKRPGEGTYLQWLELGTDVVRLSATPPQVPTTRDRRRPQDEKSREDRMQPDDARGLGYHAASGVRGSCLSGFLVLYPD